MSDSFTIKCPQMPKVSAGLKALSQQGILTALKRGMAMWGETTKTNRILRATPKDTGNLRNTITVRTKTERSTIKVTFSAGGPAAPYALAIHEHLSKYSPPSWKNASINWTEPGTGPKYIENPVNEAMPQLAGELQTEIDDALRKAFT